MNGVAISVSGCSRCGNDHLAVVVSPLSNPPEGLTHWGTCPDTTQPLLFLIVTTPDPGHS